MFQQKPRFAALLPWGVLPAFAASLLMGSLLVSGCDFAGEVPGGDEDAGDGLEVASLRFIGEQTLPFGDAFEGATIGGLSAIDRAADGTWYLLSDDRSQRAPARFYTATLDYDRQRFSDVTVTSVVELLRPDGTAFPEGSVDPEALRFDPGSKTLYWTSEGDRGQLLDPFVREMALDGTFVRTLPLPPVFAASEATRGIRQNGAFEGLARTTDGGGLWVVNELPLLQDGPAPTRTPVTSPVRLTHLNERTEAVVAQYAYPLEPVAAAPDPEDGFSINGVTEVLALSEDRLLVVERSFSAGRGNTVRVFAADVSKATNVQDVAALEEASYTLARKRLLLDFSTADGLSTVGNIEGVSFGPALANGHPTLVFVSDDNFSSTQVTQLLAFEVVLER